MAAYLIANLTVHDPAVFAQYGAQVAPIIAARGGRYLVRGGAVTPAEGEMGLGRVVIVECPDMAALRAFYDSAEYAPLMALRQTASTGTVAFVEGYTA